MERLATAPQCVEADKAEIPAILPQTPSPKKESEEVAFNKDWDVGAAYAIPGPAHDEAEAPALPVPQPQLEPPLSKAATCSDSATKKAAAAIPISIPIAIGQEGLGFHALNKHSKLSIPPLKLRKAKTTPRLNLPPCNVPISKDEEETLSYGILSFQLWQTAMIAALDKQQRNVRTFLLQQIIQPALFDLLYLKHGSAKTDDAPLDMDKASILILRRFSLQIIGSFAFGAALRDSDVDLTLLDHEPTLETGNSILQELPWFLNRRILNHPNLTTLFGTMPEISITMQRNGFGNYVRVALNLPRGQATSGTSWLDRCSIPEEKFNFNISYNNFSAWINANVLRKSFHANPIPLSVLLILKMYLKQNRTPRSVITSHAMTLLVASFPFDLLPRSTSRCRITLTSSLLAFISFFGRGGAFDPNRHAIDHAGYLCSLNNPYNFTYLQNRIVECPNPDAYQRLWRVWDAILTPSTLECGESLQIKNVADGCYRIDELRDTLKMLKDRLQEWYHLNGGEAEDLRLQSRLIPFRSSTPPWVAHPTDPRTLPFPQSATSPDSLDPGFHLMMALFPDEHRRILDRSILRSNDKPP
jgi:hypothetical protein